MKFRKAKIEFFGRAEKAKGNLSLQGTRSNLEPVKNSMFDFIEGRVVDGRRPIGESEETT